jgi:hypothetical protein
LFLPQYPQIFTATMLAMLRYPCLEVVRNASFKLGSMRKVSVTILEAVFVLSLVKPLQ